MHCIFTTQIMPGSHLAILNIAGGENMGMIHFKGSTVQMLMIFLIQCLTGPLLCYPIPMDRLSHIALISGTIYFVLLQTKQNDYESLFSQLQYAQDAGLIFLNAFEECIESNCPNITEDCLENCTIILRNFFTDLSYDGLTVRKK